MKAPSKNISASLRAQNSKAGGPDTPSVTQQRGGGPTMTVPGEGKVEQAPGKVRHGDRCAGNYADPMRRYGGG